MTDLTRTDPKLATSLREMDPASLDLDEAFAPLLAIIKQAQARAYRAVNHEWVGMCWDIGEYISAQVEAERWGKGVVNEFSRWVRRPFHPQQPVPDDDFHQPVFRRADCCVTDA